MFPIRDSIPTRQFPLVNCTLMGLNVLVFLVQISLDESQTDVWLRTWALVPAFFTDYGGALPWTVYAPFLTNMFLHGGWLHLIGNVWTLYIFGDNVEDRMGRGPYLIFYLLCGLLASMTHYITNQHSPLPALGASGAIAGVMGAYMFMFPKSRVDMLIPIFYIPFFFQMAAFWYLGYWFVLQLINGALDAGATATGGGVAFWAHIGGFVAGVLLYRVFRRKAYAEPDQWKTYKLDPRYMRRGRWEPRRWDNF
ncbi:MAG: rhomboid family intramembrane serine protease [Bacteroidia bacterium]|nr:rhomboid family intramembrane serine protease [Bacteroidia bacterium]